MSTEGAGSYSIAYDAQQSEMAPTATTLELTLMPTSGTTIDSDLFGVNFVDGYEKYGDEPWQVYDEIQAELQFTYIRFPGGSEAESLFSYENPEATIAVDGNGNLVTLTAPSDFLEYCLDVGSQCSIVLPVEQLLSKGEYGSRHFDSENIEAVRSYVWTLLEAAGPGVISMFELGNEYATYMTSTEYGKVASSLAKIVDEVISEIFAENNWPAESIPTIAVQTWGYATGDGTSLEVLTERNETVIAQFNEEELLCITATVDHLYYNEGHHQDEEDQHYYDNIAYIIEYSISLMNAWDEASGRKIDDVFSEWNVNMNDQENQGLKQIPLILSMFTEFAKQGVDQLSFWSALYKPTALSQKDGDLQAAGVIFDSLVENTMGMQVSENGQSVSGIDTFTFSGNGAAVVYVSSISEEDVEVLLEMGNILQGYNLDSIQYIGVDYTTADGFYDGLTDLEPYNEADAEVVSVNLEISELLSDENLLLTLQPYETYVLVLSEVGTLHGTDGNDTLVASSDDITIYGGAGDDEIIGTDDVEVFYSEQGDDFVTTGGGDDRFLNSGGSDTSFGCDGNDSLTAHSGRNFFYGDAGEDELCGGISDDYLNGGAGDDIIWGDITITTGGRDTIVGGEGNDSIFGGDGCDTFVFRPGDGVDQLGEEIISDGESPVSGGLFQEDLDTIVFSNFGYESAQEVFAHCEESDGTVIFSDQGTSIVLFGVSLDEFSASWILLG